jgi:hypothetical protein
MTDSKPTTNRLDIERAAFRIGCEWLCVPVGPGVRKAV